MSGAAPALAGVELGRPGRKPLTGPESKTLVVRSHVTPQALNPLPDRPQGRRHIEESRWTGQRRERQLPPQRKHHPGHFAGSTATYSFMHGKLPSRKKPVDDFGNTISCREAKEQDVSQAFGRKKRLDGNDTRTLRNGIGAAKPGDKLYAAPEYAPGFFKGGGVVAGSNWGTRTKPLPAFRSGRFGVRTEPTGHKAGIPATSRLAGHTNAAGTMRQRRPQPMLGPTEELRSGGALLALGADEPSAVPQYVSAVKHTSKRVVLSFGEEAPPPLAPRGWRGMTIEQRRHVEALVADMRAVERLNPPDDGPAGLAGDSTDSDEDSDDDGNRIDGMEEATGIGGEDAAGVGSIRRHQLPEWLRRGPLETVRDAEGKPVLVGGLALQRPAGGYWEEQTGKLTIAGAVSPAEKQRRRAEAAAKRQAEEEEAARQASAKEDAPASSRGKKRGGKKK